MKMRWLAPVVVIAAWIFAAAVYPALPDTVPTHWNLRGEVDGTMAKWPGAFLAPFIATVMLATLYLLPRIDPRRRNWEQFAETRDVLLNVLVLFVAVVEVLSLGAALGWDVNVSGVMMAAVGGLFVAMGNYLPRIRSNWWMGIRTPWTLENDRVWRATHRVAGRTFVAGGALCMLLALLPGTVPSTIAIAALIVAGLFPAVYSYFAWRRETGRGA
ncbi:MAG TPA: SdpI family protein [Longimicrobium sp.]|nr:SdpI family protein [Longimicrobium sp.]